eukprot:m.90421 g.90421  ORF g.90421 m.90421 type:complete len:1158 (-) comp12303_c0_seq8:2353-5826(-)
MSERNNKRRTHKSSTAKTSSSSTASSSSRSHRKPKSDRRRGDRERGDGEDVDEDRRHRRHRDRGEKEKGRGKSERNPEEKSSSSRTKKRRDEGDDEGEHRRHRRSDKERKKSEHERSGRTGERERRHRSKGREEEHKEERRRRHHDDKDRDDANDKERRRRHRDRDSKHKEKRDKERNKGSKHADEDKDRKHRRYRDDEEKDNEKEKSSNSRRSHHRAKQTDSTDNSAEHRSGRERSGRERSAKDRNNEVVSSTSITRSNNGEEEEDDSIDFKKRMREERLLKALEDAKREVAEETISSKEEKGEIEEVENVQLKTDAADSNKQQQHNEEEEENDEEENYDDEEFEEDEFEDDFEDDEEEDDDDEDQEEDDDDVALNDDAVVDSEMANVLAHLQEENKRVHETRAHRSHHRTLPTPHQKRNSQQTDSVLVASKSMDFKTAVRRAKGNANTKKSVQRYKALKTFVTLDVCNFNMFELAPFSVYNLYVRGFSSKKRTQTAVQCSTDCESEEVQTDTVPSRTVWTQHPPTTLRASKHIEEDVDNFDNNNNEEKEENTHKHKKRAAVVDDQEGYERFITRAGRITITLLEEQKERNRQNGQDALAHTRTRLPALSTDAINIGTSAHIFAGRCVVRVLNSRIRPGTIVTLFGPPRRKRDGVHTGLLAEWNISSPSYPRRLLVCESQPTCFCFGGKREALVIAGTRDGGLVLWDLNEKNGLDARTRPRRQQQSVKEKEKAEGMRRSSSKRGTAVDTVATFTPSFTTEAGYATIGVGDENTFVTEQQYQQQGRDDGHDRQEGKGSGRRQVGRSKTRRAADAVNERQTLQGINRVDGLDGIERHTGCVVDIVAVPPADTSVGPIQIISVDDDGMLLTWTITEDKRAPLSGSLHDLGLHPGSLVSLRCSDMMFVQTQLPPQAVDNTKQSRKQSSSSSKDAFAALERGRVAHPLLVSCLAIHPRMPGHLLVGSNMNQIVHVGVGGQTVSPTFFTTAGRLCGTCESIAIIPTNCDYFISAFNTGYLCIHKFNQSTPLRQWNHLCENVMFSKCRPAVFYTIHRSTLHMWDLTLSDEGPSQKIDLASLPSGRNHGDEEDEEDNVSKKAMALTCCEQLHHSTTARRRMAVCTAGGAVELHTLNETQTSPARDEDVVVEEIIQSLRYSHTSS